MPRKTIALKDKQTVKERVALGQSLGQAIAGTSIQSRSTALAIVQSQSNEIEHIRTRYIDYLEQQFPNLLEYTAKKLVQLLNAKKFRRGQWVDDSPTQFRALIYLHKLKGIDVDHPAKEEPETPILILDRTPPPR